MAQSARSHSTKPSPSLAPLQALVKQDLLQVNQSLLNSLDDEVPLIRELSSHIIAAGGKRIRPSLTLACSKLFNYQGARHIDLAACVELIHTATLLHDDVVDESTLRRGEATANSLFGNQASVLVGDYLLSRAFQLMVADGSLKVLKILSDAATIIAQGEVKQLLVSNNPEATEAQYMDVISSKTAALFAAACELGAVVSENTSHEEALRHYGHNIGLAFQLVDDSLDYSASKDTLGKTIGDDFREGKITLPVILAYAQSTTDEKQFWHRTLEDQDIKDGDLAHAMGLIAHYKTIEECMSRAETYSQNAIACLSGIDECAAKDALIETAHFCVARVY